jgi:hypothetical protein
MSNFQKMLDFQKRQLSTKTSNFQQKRRTFNKNVELSTKTSNFQQKCQTFTKNVEF